MSWFFSNFVCVLFSHTHFDTQSDLMRRRAAATELAARLRALRESSAARVDADTAETRARANAMRRMRAVDTDKCVAFPRG
jgi:hypothetical protein